MYFVALEIENIFQNVLNKTKYKSIIRNIFKLQPDHSVMRSFYYIAFIEYMSLGKRHYIIQQYAI